MTDLYHRQLNRVYKGNRLAFICRNIATAARMVYQFNLQLLKHK